MEAFGFEEAAADVEQLEVNASGATTIYEESATKVQEKTKSIASAKGLNVTGAGIEGIEKEVDGNGFKVGWDSRPNFHLYFHELGFHALDNRFGRVRVSRASRGARKRSYSKASATYVPPTPHLRPAVDETKEEIYEDIQNKLTKGVN